MDQWQSLSFRVLNRLHRIDIEIHSDQSALQDSEECPAGKASHQLTLLLLLLGCARVHLLVSC